MAYVTGGYSNYYSSWNKISVHAESFLSSKKSTLYKHVEANRFSNAFVWLDYLKNQPYHAAEEIFGLGTKNVFKLLLGKPSTEKSKEFLDALIETIKTTKGVCEQQFKEFKPFVYALQQGQQSQFCHLVKKHACYLDAEQIQECLRIIADCGYIKAAQRLLKHLDQDQKQAFILGEDGLPFFRAVDALQKGKEGSYPVLHSFVEAVSLQPWRSESGETVLHVLARKKADESMRLLSAVKPKEVLSIVDEEDDQGRTALALAASINDSESVRELLRCGADYRIPYQGKTPYQLTREPVCCIPNKARALLEEAEQGLFTLHANVEPSLLDATAERRQEGFIKCCYQGNYAKAVKLLEGHEVNINTLDAECNNALLIALASGQPEDEIMPFVTYLIDNQIDLGCVNDAQENALMLAKQKGFNEVAMLIQEAKDQLKNKKESTHLSHFEQFFGSAPKHANGKSGFDQIPHSLPRAEKAVWELLIESGKAEDVLPIGSEEEILKTMDYLRSLDDNGVAGLVGWLTGRHLRLLSDEQILSPSFPWNKLADSSEKLFEFLPLRNELETKRARKILKSLDIQMISILLGALSGSHLHFLSNSQCRNKAFPWNELAKSPEKVAAMFSMSFYDADRSKQLLHLLDPTVVSLLLETGGLSWETHGSAFSESQLHALNS